MNVEEVVQALARSQFATAEQVEKNTAAIRELIKAVQESTKIQAEALKVDEQTKG